MLTRWRYLIWKPIRMGYCFMVNFLRKWVEIQWIHKPVICRGSKNRDFGRKWENSIPRSNRQVRSKTYTPWYITMKHHYFSMKCMFSVVVLKHLPTKYTSRLLENKNLSENVEKHGKTWFESGIIRIYRLRPILRLDILRTFAKNLIHFIVIQLNFSYRLESVTGKTWKTSSSRWKSKCWLHIVYSFLILELFKPF